MFQENPITIESPVLLDGGIIPKDESSLSMGLTVGPTLPVARKRLYREVRILQNSFQVPGYNNTSPTCGRGMNIFRGPGSAPINIAHAIEHDAVCQAALTITERYMENLSRGETEIVLSGSTTWGGTPDQPNIQINLRFEGLQGVNGEGAEILSESLKGSVDRANNILSRQKNR